MTAPSASSLHSARKGAFSLTQKALEVLYIPFGTCKEIKGGQRFTAPLGWQLSGVAMHQMDDQLDKNLCRRFDNAGSLGKIKKLLPPAVRQDHRR